MNKKDILQKDESPCVSCPNRTDMRCTLYRANLEMTGNYILPCDECEDDCGDDFEDGGGQDE